MIEGIYREIIEDSPVAFLHIKAEKVKDIYSKEIGRASCRERV